MTRRWNCLEKDNVVLQEIEVSVDRDDGGQKTSLHIRRQRQTEKNIIRAAKLSSGGTRQRR